MFFFFFFCFLISFVFCKVNYLKLITYACLHILPFRTGNFVLLVIWILIFIFVVIVDVGYMFDNVL